MELIILGVDGAKGEDIKGAERRAEVKPIKLVALLLK